MKSGKISFIVSSAYMSFLAIIILFLAEIFGCGPATAQSTDKDSWAGSRPNIIFILADDLGYGDLSCFGNKNYNTPELDALAASGAKLTRYYSLNTVCSPSRAGLLTGLYPARLGIHDVFFPESYTGIGAAPQSIAKVLADAGYQTACVGKWHLGHHARHLPNRMGFQYYYGLPYSNDMANLTLLENDSIAFEKAPNHLLTKIYTEKAINWLEKRNPQKPFFLYLAHNMPHVPLGVSPEFENRSGYSLYGDVITELDFRIGQIRKWLIDNKLFDNTLIVFTSDNGPWLAYGPDGGCAGPLRSGKQTSYEGGIRVPCIVSWPEKIKKPVVSGEMASMADWFNSLSGWAGSEKGVALRTDGQNIEPILKGQKNKAPRELASYYAGKLEAYIYGDFKVHRPKPGRAGAYWAMAEPKSGWQLYNLATDPGETSNLTESHPEKLKEMQSKMEDFEKRMGALPPKKIVK